MLNSKVVTFAGVATLAAIGGDWEVHANKAGRYAAIAVLKDHPLPHAGAGCETRGRYNGGARAADPRTPPASTDEAIEIRSAPCYRSSRVCQSRSTEIVDGLISWRIS
ncbi:hypothetical protein ABIA14_005418 [Sinorhizobium fredii]